MRPSEQPRSAPVLVAEEQAAVGCRVRESISCQKDSKSVEHVLVEHAQSVSSWLAGFGKDLEPAGLVFGSVAVS